ncbi:actin-2 [Ascoidea rubescens DSM 1968]|uniref:Centractin n=1 Tax=Ascoidea rubescens DSM 1968 TaxID=1344418 RepID=A0A1D2VM19_9ASCO|nr:actin-2 [Ascoidea rubescens DSM 1968]ODV62595.1 actin-2 [Ascoidea rubescens DSM 1968]
MQAESLNILLNQPVVIDNGSGTIKAGFAGEERPKSYLPAIVGRPKYSRVMAGAIEDDNFIGNKAQENRGLLKIRYPISHGIIDNWDDMELLWQSIYLNDLRISAEDHPVLLTEAPLNPRKNRERMAQTFFETFNSPAIYFSIQAVLSLYSSGKTTGLVVDSGDGVSHSVPVYEGFSLPNAIRRIDLAGRDITEQLQLLLRKNGVILQTSAEKEIVRIIKEKCCYISRDPRQEERDWLTMRNSNNSFGNAMEKYESFKLPDGKIIRVGTERFRSPEILFQPDLIGSEYLPIQDMILESINKIDLDLRNELYRNIVLSGGNTLIKGFGDRLLIELKNNTMKRTKIKIYAPPERKYSTWIGGSILGGLSTFKRMWVTYGEYQENPDLIHSKCL